MDQKQIMAVSFPSSPEQQPQLGFQSPPTNPETQNPIQLQPQEIASKLQTQYENSYWDFS